MPEIAELEGYCLLAKDALHRQIAGVDDKDAYFLKGGLLPGTLAEVLVHRTFTQVHRRGKFLLLEVGSHELGLHFGMTGHLIVDRRDVADFESSVLHISEDWDRLVVHFDDGGDLRVRDRRRLGGAYLDPDLSRLGPDVLDITVQQLAAALVASRVSIKTRLLDQTRLAGVGNLIADEALWVAGIDPNRASGSLTEEEVHLLHQALRDTTRSSLERGSTSGGRLDPVRHDRGSCPLDGQLLSHRRIGGRTTWFCPAHQR